MKYEDQLFIYAEEMWISRDGVGIVSDHCVRTPEDHAYYRISGREVRYTIRGVSGNHQNPVVLYTHAITDDFPAASSVICPTRNYIREIDKTYFKFYDDAEEILNNIISFIQWLRKKQQTLKKVREMNKFKEDYGQFLKDVASSPAWEAEKASMIGFPVKRRSELKGLKADLQEDLDLVPSR